jgi:hypothetical protein
MAMRKLLLCVMVTGLVIYRVAGSAEQCEEFHVRPEDVVARAGLAALMTCLFDVAGVEVITWDKDMTSITGPGSSCDCGIEQNGQLQFNNVSLEDVGRYTCNLQVGIGDFRSCSAVLKLAGEL